jgi:hypothetical protein
LSPEFKIEFYFAKAAQEFDKICLQYNGNEELAWGHYIHKLTKERRRIGAHVVGGRLALEAAKPRTLTPSEGMACDKPLIVENDDECYICEEGGGKMKSPYHSKRCISNLVLSHFTADLICCDYCEKSFHLDCHIPRLLRDQIPSENWKCCECKAPEMPLKRCGECKGKGLEFLFTFVTYHIVLFRLHDCLQTKTKMQAYAFC